MFVTRSDSSRPTSRRAAWVLSLALLGPAVLGAAGCASGPLADVADSEADYRSAGNVAALQLPKDLDGRRIRPSMVVPELPPESIANLAVEAIDPRPTSLLDTGEGEYIRIQKLGERHWLVINEPPAVVWPRLRAFLGANRVELRNEDAGAGWLETEWVALDALSQDAVRKTLRAAAEDAKISVSGTSAKLFMRVEPGVRENSSEIHVRQTSNLIATETWPARSSIAGVEDRLLKAVGESLASAGGAAGDVSLQAQQMRVRPKSQLVRGPDGRPRLAMALDFDRAWATVSQALAKAELDITDVNRDQGVMYLRVTEADLRGEEDGMFDRLFGGGDAYSVQLHLKGERDQHALSVDPEPNTELPRAFAEQLLTLIRNRAG